MLPSIGDLFSGIRQYCRCILVCQCCVSRNDSDYSDINNGNNTPLSVKSCTSNAELMSKGISDLEQTALLIQNK